MAELGEGADTPKAVTLCLMVRQLHGKNVADAGQLELLQEQRLPITAGVRKPANE